MSPRNTARFRRLTAAFALGWALVALFAGVRGQLRFQEGPSTPFSFSSAAGVHVVHALGPEAESAGVRTRDRWETIDGLRVDEWLSRQGLALQEGVPNRYDFQRPDGTRHHAMLLPRAAASERFASDRWLGAIVPAIGLIYLAIGAVVFQVRSERREAWALLLFCCATAGAALPLEQRRPLQLDPGRVHHSLRRRLLLPPLHDLSRGTQLGHAAGGAAAGHLRAGLRPRCHRGGCALRARADGLHQPDQHLLRGGHGRAVPRHRRDGARPPARRHGRRALHDDAGGRRRQHPPRGRRARPAHLRRDTPFRGPTR